MCVFKSPISIAYFMIKLEGGGGVQIACKIAYVLNGMHLCPGCGILAWGSEESFVQALRLADV